MVLTCLILVYLRSRHKDAPMTAKKNLTEKLLGRHTVAGPADAGDDGYLRLHVNRVALQDVSGQMVLLQLMSSVLERVAVPTALHCDHLVTAAAGGGPDLALALDANAEI